MLFGGLGRSFLRGGTSFLGGGRDGFGFAEEAADFGFSEFLEAALGEAFDGEPANADADEAFDFEAEEVEHVADLPLEALLEDEVETVVAVFGPDTFGFGEAFRCHHAFDEFWEMDFGVEGFIDDDFVFFFDALTGVHEAVREVTAIGHEEEAFAFFVEASNMMKVLKLGGEQVVDGQAVVGVTTTADIALGLVEG